MTRSSGSRVRTPPAPIYFSVQRTIQVQLGLEKALGAFSVQMGVSAEGPALCGKNQTVTIVNRWYSYLTLGRLYNRDWEHQSSSESLLSFAWRVRRATRPKDYLNWPVTI